MPARYMALNPIRTITPPHDHVAPQPPLLSSNSFSLTQFLSLISIAYAVVFYVFLFILRAC